ncbi:Cellobiose dehydrogenase [Lachnellula occidentalis]|uniref:Cellobiose dehydrogenase n=1 Tax=Lachnellula occidentalis TaxID=215460 RepID=A0A8H8UKG8_9HELO|nr:Cellobiose dehydrogenase [Lachnellula occidentalis]
MQLRTLVFTVSVILKAVAADWTTQQWDLPLEWQKQAITLYYWKLEDRPMAQRVAIWTADDQQSWLKGANLTRVDVPGLFKSIFDDDNGLICSLNSYGGCTVGGSSAINAGGHFEPPASDYDLYFPPGWKSKDMQNATRRFYARQPSTNLTSQNGIRYLQSGYTAARKWLVDGLGFEDIDINSKADQKTEVFGHPIFDYANGQRGGPAITYLPAALKRSGTIYSPIIGIDQCTSKLTNKLGNWSIHRTLLVNRLID